MNRWKEGLSFYILDITPINPHTLTATPFNLHNHHYIKPITYPKAYIGQISKNGSFSLYI